MSKYDAYRYFVLHHKAHGRHAAARDAHDERRVLALEGHLGEAELSLHLHLIIDFRNWIAVVADGRFSSLAQLVQHVFLPNLLVNVPAHTEFV